MVLRVTEQFFQTKSIPVIKLCVVLSVCAGVAAVKVNPFRM